MVAKKVIYKTFLPWMIPYIVYIYAYINETHSFANLQVLISTLAAIILGNTNWSKQGLSLVDVLENVFHLCMHEYN